MNANKEGFAYTEELNTSTVNIAVENGVITNGLVKKEVEEVRVAIYIEKALKRFIDIIGGIVGCIILIPLMICIKVANSIARDNGPLFYKQKRIGKNGKEFYIYKFRSMVVGADEKLAKYLEENEEAREEYNTYKKLKNDPRITKIGHFIRKTSLDEFPQFINVLKGDMSLVGPRPYLPQEKEDMGIMVKTIANMKPGITGLWQVSGRSEATFKERLDMDREYYYNWTLKWDIKILFRTVKNCVMRKGAV